MGERRPYLAAWLKPSPAHDEALPKRNWINSEPEATRFTWELREFDLLRGQDLNLRPFGYEPSTAW
jgi:hypothetical protein